MGMFENNTAHTGSWGESALWGTDMAPVEMATMEDVGKPVWTLDERPSLLIVAPEGRRAELGAMADGAGFRVAAGVALDDMADRLALTVGLDALMIDLRGLAPGKDHLDRILISLLAWPGWSDTRPLLLTDLSAVEAISSLLHVGFDRILCDPLLSEVGTALCLLAREGPASACLNDAGRETDTVRLEQLSAEVRRLARTIDRLAGESSGDCSRGLRDREMDYAPPPSTTTDEAHGTTREEVRAVLQARRLRERFMPGELFADPAWDMMLDLLAAKIDGKRVSVSSLCIASAVPPTTALRWIAQLTERGIFERRNDPDDARRVFISLSREATDKLISWFSAVRRAGVRLAG